jgi:hypothetical protein
MAVAGRVAMGIQGQDRNPKYRDIAEYYRSSRKKSDFLFVPNQIFNVFKGFPRFI